MAEKFKLLFVCMGNICRSPAGECVMRHMLHEAGLEEAVEVDSAGTIGFHAGEPPDARMRETAARRGYAIDGRARQVTPSDLREFDLVLAMDKENFSYLKSLDSAGDPPNVKEFVSFCTKHSDKETPDPYYGGQKGFEHVLDLLEDGCAGLIEEIRRRIGPAAP